MKKLFVLTGLAVLAVAVVPAEVLAALPNYAQGGNLESDLQSKGQAITKILSLIVGIVSIMGILVGAVKIGGGNPESGKTFVISGVVALVIAGSVFGIATLVS
jgi:hypothetical protein